jgi:hypothetical protein
MYEVTDTLINALNEDVREPSEMTINFGVVEVDAPKSATLTDNGHLYYSDVTSIDDSDVEPQSLYETLELNRWWLDGVNPLPVSTGYTYQGYVSSVLSDSNGVFSTYPAITITFSTYFDFAGLSFVFDSDKNDYPTEMVITAYKDSTEVLNQTVYPDSSTWVFEEKIPVCDKIVLTVHKMNLPYRRVRITKFIYGIESLFDSTVIVSCDFTNTVSIDSTELSNMSFNFTILDSERKYDPENPSSVWEYLESRQPVNAVFGQHLDETDDNIYEMLLCNVYTTGDFSVEGRDELTQITVKCAGLLQHLTTTYYKGVYSSSGKTLYQLATEVLTDVDFLDYVELDTSLKNVSTHLPLPVMQVNELLQLIANAGRCVITHLRDGTLKIAPAVTSTVDFNLDFSKMYDVPDSSKIPPLKDFISTYKAVTVASEVSEVGSVTIDVSENTEFTISHSITTGHSISVESGVTLVGTPTYYAYQTVVTAKGSGKITVEGYKVETNDVSITKSFSSVGEDLDSISNELIDSRSVLESYMTWIGGIVERRTTYEVEHRGYPYLDVGDNFTMETNNNSEVSVTLIKDELSFNGGINGSSTLLTNEGGVYEG